MSDTNNIDKRLPAFNLYLIAISVAIVVIGLILMYIGPDSEANFEPDIFSVRRICVAPIVCLVGFLSLIGAILCPPFKR
ncbi:MAG: DUF3098 domain-containing protein [Paludibacteraceae bacterium]|nr:DUF3098 domain-containing protein [Paludibacteraceae bacterium]MBQ1752527.1 DUF3098 domain-containing protein [Paludibacteraceae bacterium]MBQ1851620.1 DUF3098 domain-containing protein [Paludibacteraceae bacterium]MBQ2064994.1 DUF3098 domain-containing protein [Paludibacteraceae bacterium]